MKVDSGQKQSHQRYSSRGFIIKQLQHCANLDQVTSALSAFELSDFRPFRVLAIDKTSATKLFVWNGQRLEIEKENITAPKSSSSVDSEQVKQSRKLLFNEMGLENSQSRDDFLRFHRSHEPHKKHSVCVHRECSKTVSLSHIVVDQQSAYFNYYAGSPCENTVPVTKTILRFNDKNLIIQLKLLKSSLRRIIRWEFWPMWIFYVPILFYIVFLAIRFRGLTFLNVNPGMVLSGVVGDDKASNLNLLQTTHPESIATFRLLGGRDFDHAEGKRFSAAEKFMQDNYLEFPVVLKPNKGQRGSAVAVIRSEQEMKDYLWNHPEDILIQKHISGEEFGIFYYWDIQENKGEILSITHKCFPKLIGDGESNLRTLILDTPRTNYMARYLLQLHEESLDHVLKKGEEFITVEIGSHCRGSLFLDGNEYYSEALRTEIAKLSKAVPDFYFGRYDVRVPSIEDLQKGRNIQILEVNGVTSESTHIYDPKHSVFYAYKALFKQWKLAFQLGADNLKQNDSVPVSLKQFLEYVLVKEKSWR